MFEAQIVFTGHAGIDFSADVCRVSRYLGSDAEEGNVWMIMAPAIPSETVASKNQ